MAENARTIEQLGEKAKSASESIGKLEDSLKKLDSIIGTISKKFEVGTDNTGKMEDAVKKLTKETETYQKKNFTETLGKVNDVLQELPGGMTDVFEGMKKLSSGTDTNIQDFTTFVGSASGLVTSLSKSVNPAFGIITTVAAGAAGVIASVVDKMDKLNDIKFEKDHFGNLTWSLERIRDIAKDLVNNDYLGKIETSFSEFEKVEDFKSDITNSLVDLQNTEWRVSIGIELTESEVGDYKQSTDDYIKGVEDWIEQQHYTAIVSLNTLIKDPEQRAKIQQYFDDFYGQYESELNTLQGQLSNKIEEALQDGVLDADEAQAIAELRGKVDQLISSIEMDSHQARLESIVLKAGGAAPDKESFDNLCAQIDSEAQEIIDSYERHYEMSVTSAQLLLSKGAINTDEYDEMIEDLKRGKIENIGEIQLRATQVKTDLLKGTFEEELQQVTPQMMSIIDKYVSEWRNKGAPAEGFQGMVDNLQVALGEVFKQLEPETREKMQEYFQSLSPSREQLISLREEGAALGAQLPEGFNDALLDLDMLDILAMNSNGLYEVIAASMKDSPELWAVKDYLLGEGSELSGSILNGMSLDKQSFSEMGISFIYRLLDASGMTMEECKSKFMKIFGTPADICQEVNEEHSPSRRFARSGNNMVYGLLSGLQETWGNLIDWWKNSALGAWWSEYISPWFTWEKWSGLARGAIDALLSPFRNISWPSLKMPRIEWISGGTQATGFLKTVLDFLHLPTSLPKLKVSWYAKGGIFDSPQIIGVGEHGREAVVPLERNTQWIDTLALQIQQKQNLNEQDDPREALTVAIAPAVTVLAAKLERVIQAVEQVDTTVELDGEKISRSTTKYINNRTRREGRSPILV